MNWWKIKNSSLISDEDLEGVIITFKSYFQELINSDQVEVSAVLGELVTIEKSKIDQLIDQWRDALKYNFFTNSWEKKENLNLILKLKEILKKINNEINKQNQNLVVFEKKQLSIMENNINKHSKINVTNNVSTDFFNLFNFLSENIKINVNMMDLVKLKFTKTAKELINKLQNLKNEVNEIIKKLGQEIKDLENKNEKILESLFKEANMTMFILSFCSFRMKNNNDSYQLKIEGPKLIKTDIKKDFSFSLQSLETIFNLYIEKMIKSEEKLVDDVFIKYNDKKISLEKEKETNINSGNQLNEELKAIMKAIEEYNKAIAENKNELTLANNNYEKLLIRKQNIKTKAKSFSEDLAENKGNIENEITFEIESGLDEKKIRKKYLKKLDEKIMEKEEKIKQINKLINNLNHDLKRSNTELEINNDKRKIIKKAIKDIDILSRKEDCKMIENLKIIKTKWFKKINKYQKQFILFLRDINKFEDKKFIKFVDDYWKNSENKKRILELNGDFDIMYNIDNIEEKNKKIETDLEISFKQLMTDFELEEKKIIPVAKEEIKESLNNSLKIINEPILVNIATQTQLHEKSTTWEEEKLKEQEQTIKTIESKLEQTNNEKNAIKNKLEKFIQEKNNADQQNSSKEVKEFEDQLLRIKVEYDKELNELNQDLEKITEIQKLIEIEKERLELECNELKNKLKIVSKKKEVEEVKELLKEKELRLLYVKQLKTKVTKIIKNNEEDSTQEWEEIDLSFNDDQLQKFSEKKLIPLLT